jgi:hypothetical protein
MKALGINILGGLIGAVIFAALVYFFGYLNIIPKIDAIYSNVSEIRNEIIEIKDNYLIKDADGIDVTVGVSSEANDHLVIIFSDNPANLDYSDSFELYYTVGKFSAKLKLLASIARDRGEDKSRADIFISKEAAETIGFKDYQKTGIVKMKARKLEHSK